MAVSDILKIIIDWPIVVSDTLIINLPIIFFHLFQNNYRLIYSGLWIFKISID